MLQALISILPGAVEVAESTPCLRPDEPGSAWSVLQTEADRQIVGRPFRISHPELRKRPVEVATCHIRAQGDDTVEVFESL